MSPAVVGLRMWCDLDRRHEGTGGQGAWSFRVSEFALLSDGREVVLLDDRGWGGNLPDDYLSRLTIHDIEQEVFHVLLPDYADVCHPLPPDLAEVEVIGGAQDWELLAQRMNALGVAVEAATLRTVPRRVDISSRLRVQVQGEST